MKIVEVCPYDMARHGGVQNHILDLAAWLTRHGHEVRIIAPPPLKGADVPGVTHVGRSKLIGVLGTVTEISYLPGGEKRALAEELNAWGADVLHMHTPWTPLLAWQVWRAARLPSVATFHATLPESAQRGLSGFAYGAAGRYFLKRLEAAVVPSVSPLAHLIPPQGVAGPRILPPTIDLSDWRRAALAGDKPTDPQAPHVVFLGRLEDRKGVGVLLEAWKAVAACLPRARLTIAGSGPQQNLVDSALAADSGRSITHLPAPDRDAARKLVAEADLFAAPAPYGESFGLVLIEAMAAGTVPVAAANTGYRTVLEGGGEKLMVPPGNAGALAERILELAASPGLLREARNWGMERAARFDVEAVGPRYVELFEEVRQASRRAKGAGTSGSASFA
ncbi:glycosyltransferase family 4 protein [Stappia sp. F7233]|uniref:Glycosyltransferase family 4 protein n=1 Tax=Stappia albiluteola TaxID=2758565 RepID=A0A839AII3_9HYPH|nr:glycosyltransferase family 4 protein [Stappia albiluteola]MBA5778734.1 glycosyltransferase family 4 protein [Stappia albiluteola]